MKYKVGDRVKIKSLDWYNENKDEDGNIRYRHGTVFPIFFTKYMSRFCGETLTIKCVHKKSYYMNETGSCEFWTDEMIEGLVEEETKPLTYEETVEIIETMQGIGDSWECPQGYQFVDENGNVINATKIVLEKKEKSYPKTYEECCNVLSLGEDGRLYTKGYKASLIQNFQKLLICRDAYWKIAGEEMGLGEPWKPDWKNNLQHKHYISTEWHEIKINFNSTTNKVLAFPTAEMRDAFKENFDPDLEICKELL